MVPQRKILYAAVAAGTLLAADANLDVVAHRPAADTWKRTQCGGPSGTADIPSKWAAEVSPSSTPLKAYPRPQMVRGTAEDNDKLRNDGDADTWTNLNGLWEWETATSSTPTFGKTLAGSILVPFPVESCLSGVAPQKSADIVKEMWYRLTFDALPKNGRSTLLHFGAVDWQATVYLNKQKLGQHTGGYDGFSFDITSSMADTGSNELLVYVYDPSDSGAQPNGKQRISAIDRPGGDTYTPSSGIWQTVWLEDVPVNHIEGLKIDQASLTTLKVAASVADTTAKLTYEVQDAGKTIASATGSSGKQVEITIPAPAKLWSPASPNLYDLVVTSGEDKVVSYFGLRTFVLGKGHEVPEGPYTKGLDRGGDDMAPCGGKGCVMNTTATSDDCEAKCKATAGCMVYVWADADCSGQSGPICWLKNSIPSGSKKSCRDSRVMAHTGGVRPLLNGDFTFMAGFLDQSWWPDGQYTAPTDAALESDLTATKMFGLNMIRLHQKVNPERWYYFADKHGLAIFQDMVQKYGHASNDTIAPFVEDLKAMIHGKGNHPCIVQWETFNEGDCWSVFKTPPYDVAGIVKLAKELDPTRLVDTDSGGGANNMHIADVNDIHTYPYPGDPQPSATQYGMIGEFGGIGAFVQGKEWVPGKCHTYLHVDTPADESSTYVGMAKTIESRVDHVSASVYTQTTDLELECDGFLNYDRTNKFNAEQTKAIADSNQAIIDAGHKKYSQVNKYISAVDASAEQIVV